MGMDYSKISDWIIREDCFDTEHLGKCEAIMSLGNGYLGLRSATEEHYLNETRGMFIAGTFNKFDELEVTELPNAADVTAIDIFVNEERFSLANGVKEDYTRELNIRTGELKRSMAYDLFQKVAMIDLGSFMNSSNAGIHAASFGGVWECVVYGFGGVRMLGGKLRIKPSLPDEWTKLSYTIIWKGQKIVVEVTKDEVHVENLTGTKKVEIEVNGNSCLV